MSTEDMPTEENLRELVIKAMSTQGQIIQDVTRLQKIVEGITSYAATIDKAIETLDKLDLDPGPDQEIDLYDQGYCNGSRDVLLQMKGTLAPLIELIGYGQDKPAAD